PDPDMHVSDEDLAWAASLALEMRRRVKEAQAFIGAAEFGRVDLSYRLGTGPEIIVYCDGSVKHRMRVAVEADPGPLRSRTAAGGRCITPTSSKSSGPTAQTTVSGTSSWSTSKASCSLSTRWARKCCETVKRSTSRSMCLPRSRQSIPIVNGWTCSTRRSGEM